MLQTVKNRSFNYNASPDSYINEHSSSIRIMYEDYDTDQDGRLTKADFLRFY